MPFINMELGSVGESYPVPTGTYDLVILKAVEQASRNKKEEEGEDAEPNMLVVTIGVQSDEHPDAAPFRAWFTYPEDGGEYNDMRIRELKRFLYWFGCPFEDNGFNSDDLEGLTASQIQVNKEVNADTGREFNEMVLDPIPTEDGAEAEATEEEAPAEEEQVEEETVEEEAVEEEQPEEEVVEEEPEPAPTRRAAPKAAAKTAARPASGKAAKPAPKAAPKAAAKAAPKGKGRR